MMHKLFLYSSSTSTCFRHISAHHQEVQPLCIKQLVHIILMSLVLVGLEFGLELPIQIWFGTSNPTRTTDSHLKRIISTNCCIHKVVPPDDGPSYTKNKLCIKLVFLYMFRQQWQTFIAHHQQQSMLLKVTGFNITQNSKCCPCNIYAASSYEKQQFRNYRLNLISFQMYKHQPITKDLRYT